ncbi:hypothetical protein [Desertivirga arenae]|uniref:hypothetical protein n=1 Tax=Desertivirga arenae TaxID=2810309 RepID=UPI001A95E0E5|nr:hypothetical protein [Pedobacter sp. SYSU D00823]
MEKRNSLDQQVARFAELDKNVVSIEQKLDELILLLNESDLDSATVQRLQTKFNTALSKEEDRFKAFQKLDDPWSSRLEMADDLENLLSTYQVDSKASKKYLYAERLLKFVLMLTSIVLITLGFSLIVLPQPAEFEMFTIYHFTTDDGFTLMDLIALLIVLAGVYLLIRSIIRTNNNSAD